MQTPDRILHAHKVLAVAAAMHRDADEIEVADTLTVMASALAWALERQDLFQQQFETVLSAKERMLYKVYLADKDEAKH